MIFEREIGCEKMGIAKSGSGDEGSEIRGDEDSEKIEIKGRYLTSLGTVKVYPPPNRQDLVCFLYGDISFTDHPSNPPITLFRRLPTQEPDLVILGDYRLGFLNLSDHDSSDRPLVGLTIPIYVNMKLYERKDGGGDDELIADVTGFKFGDGKFDFDISVRVLVQGKSGFDFEVDYASVFGVRVEVEVGIDQQLVPSKRDSSDQVIPKKIPIWGHVTAVQEFNCPNCECGRTTISLWDRDDEVPVNVEVGGSPICLDRKVVVAPLRRMQGQFLSIGLNLCGVGSDTPIVNELIHFQIHSMSTDPDSFLTNKDMTMTKQAHGIDIVFSVSIKFLP